MVLLSGVRKLGTEPWVNELLPLHRTQGTFLTDMLIRTGSLEQFHLGGFIREHLKSTSILTKLHYLSCTNLETTSYIHVTRHFHNCNGLHRTGNLTLTKLCKITGQCNYLPWLQPRPVLNEAIKRKTDVLLICMKPINLHIPRNPASTHPLLTLYKTFF